MPRFHLAAALAPLALVVTELEQWSQAMWPGPTGQPNDFSVLCP